jgi:alanine dehydrogenase
MTSRLSFGFPCMRQESGERRDFLPELVGHVAELGCPVVVEHGLGAAMGLSDADYLAVSPTVRIGEAPEAFAQDVVMVLRAPDDRLEAMRSGALLISMLHYPTRPARVRRLLALGIDAISLDSIVDDRGRRLVENMRAVGWNGLDAAFEALSRTCPWLTDPARGPIRVTVLGAGTVGKYAVEAATQYGSFERDATLTAMGLPGVEVTVAGRNVTGHAVAMCRLFRRTDVLVDATQRSDPSRPLVPNSWLAYLPHHAVICDLVVDPYLPDGQPPTVRSIEGIPLGDLNQWVFTPDDPHWDRTVPADVPSEHRRTVVSCRAWPGLRPEECMRHYGEQLAPLLSTLVARAGVAGLRADGGMRERALRRGELRHWLETPIGNSYSRALSQAVAAR